MKWSKLLLLSAIISFSSCSATQEKHPSDWIKDAKFKHSYTQAIEQAKLKGKIGKWFEELELTASPSKPIELNGQNWISISGCKPHDCPISGVDLLYNEKTEALYGLVKNDLTLYFIGSPSLPIRQLLVSRLQYW